MDVVLKAIELQLRSEASHGRGSPVIFLLLALVLCAAYFAVFKATEKWRACSVVSTVIGVIFLILVIMGSCARTS